MENIDKDSKPQNDPAVMKKLVQDQNLSSREIASLLHISKKLVDIKLKEHGLK